MQPFTSGLTTGTGGNGIGYPVGLMTIGRERRERETDAGYLVNATDLTGKFDTGIINHTLTAGVELSREIRNQTRTDLCVPTGATANLACYTSLVNPTVSGVPATGFTFVPGNQTLSTDYAAYVIDQMKITKYFELLGSFRFDRFYTHFLDGTGAPGQQDLKRTDNLPSYRFGAVYHPTPNSSIYVVYGNSYNPSAELGTLSGSANNAASVTLAPEKNISYEAGVKVDVLEGNLSLTGAVFRIEKTNLRIPGDPTAPTAQQFLVLDGLARVDGFEAGAAGKVTDKWQVIGGYSYLDSSIAKTSNLAELGRWLPNAPRHNLSVWTTYDITPEIDGRGRRDLPVGRVRQHDEHRFCARVLEVRRDGELQGRQQVDDPAQCLQHHRRVLFRAVLPGPSGAGIRPLGVALLPHALVSERGHAADDDSCAQGADARTGRALS